jgi:hypothetical protein
MTKIYPNGKICDPMVGIAFGTAEIECLFGIQIDKINI